MNKNPQVARTVLGRSGISVGKLSLGAWGLWNPDAAPPARTFDDDAIIEMFQIAFDAGMNLLDSADAYENEEQLGRVLRHVDNVPKDLVVSTKFGHGKGFDGDQVRRSVERSLSAFGIDSIPLFMLHDPRTAEDMADIASSKGALPALRRLQDEGTIGSIGIATAAPGALLLAVDSDEYDVVQFPRLYTLLTDAAKSSGLLDKAREKNIGTILTSPFGGNILATGVRKVEFPRYCFSDAIPEVIDAVAAAEARADELGIPLPQAAVAYPLQQELIDVVVLGAVTAQELREDIRGATTTYSDEDIASIADAAEVDDYFLGGPEFLTPFPKREVV